MKDLILKWWNRKWSNWKYEDTLTYYDRCNRPLYNEVVYIQTSNDGLVRYKKIKV